MHPVLSDASHQEGFTLIELLIVVTIIGLLSSLVLVALSGIREESYLSKAQAQFNSFRSALILYTEDQGGVYPDDVSRSLPPGLEEYLSSDNWPEAPWPGSVYDWDNWQINGEQVVQLSIRFCDRNAPNTCNFPDKPWAENFGVNSAVYYCFEGNCRSHEGEPEDYPGLCVNCGDLEEFE